MAERRAPVPALRRARVEIDLGALERNFDRVASHVPPARVLAVVKADAYGHGAIEVARCLEPRGVAGFAVALAEEGIELRGAGVRAPVLVLSPLPREAYPFLRRYRLTPAISGVDQLAALEAFALESRWPVGVHLKFDTGMSRLGMPWRDAGEILDRVRRSAVLRLEGVMSHLAEAETPDSPANEEQAARFETVLGRLAPAERETVAVHLANSAAALHRPEERHGLVRCGLALFGLDPARPRAAGAFEPVATVVAEIVQVKELEAGERVGYGGRWVAQRPSRIAIVPVGYADGYSWRLGNRGEALVGGRRVPVAGAVSMDLLALDVTDAEASVGDEVVLAGRRGAAELGVGDLAAAAETVPYELLCLLGLRLPRVAVRGDRPAAVDRRSEAPVSR
ncbi:MAG: alanine racemase [Acidobacteria bacterium]|nr:alanine racemase [Acidobacteriota bacterium]MCB9377659.1 alanine racemase [Holophagales bacterium]